MAELISYNKIYQSGAPYITSLIQNLVIERQSVQYVVKSGDKRIASIYSDSFQIEICDDLLPAIGIARTGTQNGYPVFTVIIIDVDKIVVFPTNYSDLDYIVTQISSSAALIGINEFSWSKVFVFNKNYKNRFCFDQSYLYEKAGSLHYYTGTKMESLLFSNVIPLFSGTCREFQFFQDYYLELNSIGGFIRIVSANGKRIESIDIQKIVFEDDQYHAITESGQTFGKYNSIYELNELMECTFLEWPEVKEKLISNLPVCALKERAAELMGLTDISLKNLAKESGIRVKPNHSRSKVIESIVRKFAPKTEFS